VKQQDSMRAAVTAARRAAVLAAATPTPTPSVVTPPAAVAVRSHPLSPAEMEHGTPVSHSALAHQAQVLSCLTVLHALLSFLQWVHVRRVFPLSSDCNPARGALLAHQTDLLHHEIEVLFSLLCAEPAPPPACVDAKAALAHTTAALRLCGAWMS